MAGHQSTKNRGMARRAQEAVRLAKSQPCMDCGNSYPPYVMDFDHVRGEKKFQIGNVSHHKSMGVLLAEIAKCDVVCANCHRVRTHGTDDGSDSE